MVRVIALQMSSAQTGHTLVVDYAVPAAPNEKRRRIVRAIALWASIGLCALISATKGVSSDS